MRVKKKSLIDYLVEKHAIAKKDAGIVGYWIENYPIEWVEKVLGTPNLAKRNFSKVLAKYLNLKYIPESMLMEKKSLCRFCPPDYLKKAGLAPVEFTDKKMVFATYNPFNKKLKKAVKKDFKGKKIEFRVADKDAIMRAVDEGYKSVVSLMSTSELWYRQPEDSAHRVLTLSQKVLIVFSTLVMVGWFLLDYPSSFIFVFAVVNIAYFTLNPTKILSIIYISLSKKSDSIKVSKKEIRERRRKELPVYTILVPLYREVELIKKIVEYVNAIDYPADKKDVKILLEESDAETISEAKNIGLLTADGRQGTRYPSFEVLILPTADIRTKPRSCNFGLHESRGEYLVIYDAEDHPDKDQLLKAVVGFEKTGKDVACLQALLNFYNDRENLLTRWFSIEYTAWFEYYLPSLEKIKAPIPLGGTSNHFRVETLRNAGSWDPYNVTEDADLGLRIYRTDLKTRILESHTYEEANNRVWNWIRQRSRWEKGFIQTYLVHMRNPFWLIKKLGFRKFILFQMTFGANTMLPLINPFLWIISGIYVVSGGTAFSFLTPYPMDLVCIVNLTLGNIFYILFHLIAAFKSGKKYHIIPSFFIPFYWILMSVAAWKGLIQLITKPFYWEKTIHGISNVKK